MVVKTCAIVFSAIKYGEADLITTCYTEADGIKTYMLKNVLKSKRGNLRAALFQPLTHLSLIANHKNKGTLEYLKEAKIEIPYKTLHTHIYKSGIVIFLAEVLKNTIKEEQPNPALFKFLSEAALWLDESEHFGNFHISFLLQLSGYLGFSPDNSHLEYRSFNLMEGRFEPEKSDIYSVESSVVEYLKEFLGKTYEETVDIRMTRSVRQELLELIIAYFQLHIQSFSKPQSLSILHQIFK